jgi:hypothetical protein
MPRHVAPAAHLRLDHAQHIDGKIDLIASQAHYDLLRAVFLGTVDTFDDCDVCGEGRGLGCSPSSVATGLPTTTSRFSVGFSAVAYNPPTRLDPRCISNGERETQAALCAHNED